MNRTDDEVLTALRDTAGALTDRLQGHPDSLQALLDEPAARRAPRRSTVRRFAPALAAVAAAAVVAATLVVGLRAGGPTATPPVAPAGDGSATLSAGPYPTSDYFLATEPQRGPGRPDVDIVRARDGRVVRAVPVANMPVLSPDGTTIYHFAGGSPLRLYAFDIASGTSTLVDGRRGMILGATLSADGSTLAYQWTAVLRDPEHSTGIVVRDLRSGAVHVLAGAPGGPQILSMALSPDGSRLALVPTLTTHRPLEIVPTSGSDAFAHAITVAACDRAAEPRWTVHGLYVLGFCGSGADLMRVDLATATATALHQLGPEGIWAYTPLPGPHGDRFVVADESQSPPRSPVTLLDPAHGWSATPYSSIERLEEVTSE